MTVRELFVTLGFQADQGSLSKTESIINNLKNMAGKALGAIGIGLSAVALKRFATECVNLASSAEQIQNKFDVVFKGMDKEANKWAEDYSKTVGRSVTTIKGYMADAQNLLVGFMGDERREEAMQMSEQMTELALDIASFSNMNEDEAVARMTKAVMGQSEAAKSLGAVLNETTRAEAMAQMGLQGKYDSLDMATRMQVNYNAILSQSQDAIGDCVRSMDSYESRQRQLNSSVRYFKEYVGTQLLPVAARVLKFGNDIVQKGTDWAKNIVALNSRLKISSTIGAGLGRIWQGLGSVMDWLHHLVDIFVVSVGGVDNALRAVAITAGVLITIFNPMITIIAAIMLAIEDFVTFMQGGFSVTGGIFEKFGIDAYQARMKIQSAFDSIKKIVEGSVRFFGKLFRGDLKGAWDNLKSFADEAIAPIKAFFEEQGFTFPEINLGETFDKIVNFAAETLDALDAFFQGEKLNFPEISIGDTVNQIISFAGDTLDKIEQFFLGEDIKLPFPEIDVGETLDDVINFASSTIETIANFFRGEKLDFPTISMGDTVDKIISFATDTLSKIIAFFTGDQSLTFPKIEIGDAIDEVANFAAGAIESIANFFGGQSDELVFPTINTEAFSSVVEFAEGALKSINDFFESKGITIPTINTEAFQPIIDFASGVLKTITDFFNGELKFPEIDLGPLQPLIDFVDNKLSALKDFFFGGTEEERAEAADYYGSMGGTGESAAPVGDWEVDFSGSKTYDEQIAEWVGNGRISQEAADKLIAGIDSAWAEHGDDWAQSGFDMLDLLAGGINDNKYLTDAAVEEVAQGIADYIGFSVPAQGPLSDADSYMPDFMTLLSEGITSNSEAVVSAVETMAQGMSDALKQAFQDMASAAQTGMSQVQSSVQTGMSAVLATMQSLAAQAYTNGLHFVENLVNGINAGLPALRAAASEVAAIMSEQVKHSVPKKGPMKDDDQWMRHYMQNLANGIKQNKGLVTDQMSTLAQDLASLGRPASSRAAASAGGFSRRMMSVNQNVTISNSYNGTAGGADRAIRNTMKKSAYDASTYMAKAIGYARG